MKAYAGLKARVAAGSLSLLLLGGVATLASASPVIKARSGGEQQTTYSAAFPAPLTVWVVGSLTRTPEAGVRVEFTAEPGIKLSAAYAITDKRGVAQVMAKGIIPCTSRVIAKVEGSDSQVSFDELVVNKAILTVLPSDLESKPGVVPEISSYTIQGFVNGETEDSAHVSGTPVLSTTANNDSHYGNYAIKGGIGSLTAPNYEFVAGFGTLAITADPNSANPLDRPREASAGAAGQSVTVHPAMLEQLMTAPAGVLPRSEKERSIPVQAAILPASVSGKVTGGGPAGATKTALAAPTAAEIRREEATPVQAAIGPISPVPPSVVLATAEPVAPIAMPGVTARAMVKVETPVRAAIAQSAPTASSGPQFTYTGSTIRTALVPPGTN